MTMTRAVVCYTDRSCVTGKALWDAMRNHDFFSSVERVRKTKTVRQPDLVVRWGNSTSPAVRSGTPLELNTASAVSNASNKLTMMRMLSSAETVNTPTVYFLNDHRLNQSVFEAFKDSSGKCFIRGSNGSIRYDDTLRSGDKYITKPVNKDREYRVHVFNGKVLGIYEKVPQEEGVMIYKDHNCNFRKCNPEAGRLRCNETAQQMCIDAISTLGLLFGGVDIMRDTDGNFYVCEVNSSPSLNSINVEKYVEEFINYFREVRDV